MPILNRTDKGWSWVVMISAFANHLNQGFFVTGIGVLQVALLEKYPGAVAKASWATGLLVGCHLMLGPVGGAVINRWSCRAALMIGSFLMTVGLVLSAFVNDLIYVIILMGVVSGVGAGLSTTASEVVIGFNFVRYRNFACGVAVSGTGIGTLIFTSLMQMAKDEYGYTGFLLICGGICFQQVAFGALCRPSYLERKSKDDREKDESRTVLSDFLQSLSLLRRPSFFCLCSSMFAAIFGVFTMNVHFTSLVIDQGTSESEAAFFLSIAGACNAFSRLLIGTAANADNINELLLYSGCFSVLGGTATALPLFIEYHRGQIAFAVILGTYSGCCFSLLNSITVKLVGIENLAMAYGLEYFAGGFGGVVGPVILGICKTSFNCNFMRNLLGCSFSSSCLTSSNS
ncbi:hypothetical protein FSP39_009414 [Pinctada imbricata]|uniref:Uncharacterized protein n=1 Tax=Pinctada imbricata TaxID=66713 RepID=A0AA89C4C8_PINIB|nr:hypothetical protein FSP39_009414 [Pinctada imbricata]